MGLGYSIFDTAIGRCGVVWGELGVVGVQLPQAREIETRRRLFQLYPEAREQRPPLNAEIAIEGIVALLLGRQADFSHVVLDMSGVAGFDQRVYHYARTIPRGETRTYGEVARALRVSSAAHTVAQAISRTLHDHRALSPRAGRGPLHRPDLAEWRGDFETPVAVRRGHPHDQEQDAVRCPAARCATPGA